MLIDTESGMAVLPAAESSSGDTVLPAALPTPLTREQSAADRIFKMIRGASDGSLPLERELYPWEAQKLNATHISMCIDRALGFNIKEVAEKHGYGAQHTARILLHPYAQLLISTMLAASADRVQDIDTRLELLAPEALNVKVDILRSSKSEGLKNKIASDLLDRAGYGSRKKQETNERPAFQVPAALAATLGEVLRESQQVAIIDYSRFISPSSESNSPGRDNALQPGTGHTGPVAMPPVVEVEVESAEAASEREEKEWANESKRLKIA